jgi:hypothetical protein
MRSLADVRVGLERGLRLLVIAALAWCLVRALTHRADAAEGARSDTLRSALARWSTVSAPGAVRVSLDRPPPGLQREWLAALASAGTDIHWSGDSLLPTAVAVAPLADPAGSLEAGIAAPAGRTVVLGDATGVLDSARVEGHGVRFRLASARGGIEGRVGVVGADNAPRDSLQLRRLLVVGQAGWEMKFVVAALAERGWAVDAHFVVSPKSDVVQGGLRAVATAPAMQPQSEPADQKPGLGGAMGRVFRPDMPGAAGGAPPVPVARVAPPAPGKRALSAIDTSRYSAVLAIDSSASRYAALIDRYVRQGGGLVLWSGAARAAPLAQLAAGRGFGELVEGSEEWPADARSRIALDLLPISGLRDDAVVLERRDPSVVSAARRIEAGRTVTLGYVDTWRWRMAGVGEAPEAHRTWLAGLVAGVAYSPRGELAVAGLDPAPLASLISLLGRPAAPGGSPIGGAADPSIWWVFGFICGALLLEWASRRVRGVK